MPATRSLADTARILRFDEVLVVVRVVGLVIGILGIAMVRREREDAADDKRPIRRGWVAIWAVVIVVGVAAGVWAIFAS